MNELATMKTKTGFKQTEVGLIPEDWEVKTIDEIADVNGGGTPSTTISEFWNGSINWFTPTEIGYSKYVNESKRKITHEGLNKSSAKILPKGTVLLTSRAGIGDIAILELESSTNQGFQSLTAKENTSNEFLYYLILISKEQLLKKASGSTFLEISPNNVKSIQIPLPPLHEQKAIATALSDVDALIQSLDALIAKKKAIKQGAMQELLTPKDGWKTKTIKEVSTFRRGSFPQPYGLPKWYDDISGMPFVQVVDVAKNRKLKTETKQRISEEGAKMSVFVKKGSIILTIQGSIGRICITQYDAYVDRTLLIFESLLEEFNKYFFMTIVHQKFEIEKEKAPGGIIKTITKEALSSFEVSYPNIIDQNRIAQILSDMDLEIESLEKKKEKYEEIKQGMMQELLTGKTRLV
ncbi:restriction endonuclease subunit S [Brumimicrobium sp.]|uniref:restriction endonuclease subunit S n=1 Tax=Brumimicrobium sp. TaxID=2029867 RepID=UPI003A92514E